MSKYKVSLAHFGIIAVVVFTTITLRAHPSWGIVVDNSGCIYFVDVLHDDGTLWKIDPTDRSVHVIFSGLHAHEIFIDEENNIYAGVAIWRSGEIEGEGHNYIFKYNTSSSQLDTLLFTDDWDEFHGQTFAAANNYQDYYFTINQRIFDKHLDRPVESLIDHEFERVNTLAVDKSDNLWITNSKRNNGTLYRWNRGEGLVEVAHRLLSPRPEDPIFEEPQVQIFYGISFDQDGNPLIADNVDRQLKKVSKDGTYQAVYESEKFWHPAGVAFGNGHYYIMEAGYNKRNIGPRIIVTDLDFKEVDRYVIDFAKKIIE